MRQAIRFVETLLEKGEPSAEWSGKQYVIGMHPKWLTEAEADHAIIFFSGITDANYYTHYIAQEANLVRFFLALHQANTLLVFEEATAQFLPVRKVADLVQLITLGTRELNHYIIYSPLLHTVFVDAHDVSSVAYVLHDKENIEALATMYRLAQANGLHLLS